jgi:YebC/PmpR family DNA-binding regulatory protein
MAGHSKWANIKHRKAAQDAKRGKVFTKIIRELVVAAKAGGANPEDNPRLRAAVDKALGANMKRDTIDKAVARGAGAGEGENYDEITYEGYAPGGIAVMVACMTDNRNRTVSDVRHCFTKRGGNLGTDGSVAYLFKRVAQYQFADVDEDLLIDAALDAGAEDVYSSADKSMIVEASWDSFLTVKDAMIASGFVPNHSEVTFLATTEISLEKAHAATLIALVDALEDLDDVQAVYTNGSISEAILAEID